MGLRCNGPDNELRGSIFISMIWHDSRQLLSLLYRCLISPRHLQARFGHQLPHRDSCTDVHIHGLADTITLSAKPSYTTRRVRTSDGSNIGLACWVWLIITTVSFRNCNVLSRPIAPFRDRYRQCHDKGIAANDGAAQNPPYVDIRRRASVGLSGIWCCGEELIACDVGWCPPAAATGGGYV